MARRPMSRPDAERLVAELECCSSTVKLYEDGDLQEDGTVLWSGCATGECPVCGQMYVDWWEGTFKIGEPRSPGR